MLTLELLKIQQANHVQTINFLSKIKTALSTDAESAVFIYKVFLHAKITSDFQKRIKRSRKMRSRNFWP